MVVKFKAILVNKSPLVLDQTDLNTHAGVVNAFLATLAATNVLDVRGEFAPGGKDGIRSVFFTTIAYLG